MAFELAAAFGTRKPVLGMVHLESLPGSPGFAGDLDAVVDRAVADARALEAGGVDGVVVENFGDAPFYPEDVPDHTVASMTRVAVAVADATDLPLGVNVLRNDAAAAVAVAAAVGAAFVRVNVHAGARVTDQGVVEGRAHETIRLRERLGADVRVFADVDVKHSAALAADADPVTAFAEAVERGLADAAIVSGRGTGDPVDADALHELVDARERFGLDAPILVGSGVREGTVAELLAVADGAIVGTALKEGDETTAPVDEGRVAALVERADAVR